MPIARSVSANGCARTGEALCASRPILAGLAIGLVGAWIPVSASLADAVVPLVSLHETADPLWAEALPAPVRTRVLEPPPEGDLARRSLDDVLAEIAFRPEPPASPRVESARRLEALQAYTRGRTMLLSGDHEAALEPLTRATLLDDAAAEPWRELGEAFLALRRRAEALKAFENAVHRGAHDGRTLLLFAGELLNAGQTDRAAAVLALAIRSGVSFDVERLALANLANLLDQQGMLLAGIEAIERALRDWPFEPGGSVYSRELAELAQRAPALFIYAGDQAMRLGRFEQARTLYGRIREVRSTEFLADRLVAASLAERDTPAALAVIAEAAADPAHALDERLIRLARLIGTPRAGNSLLSDRLSLLEPPGEAQPSESWRQWQMRLAAAASADREQILSQLAFDFPREIDPVIALLRRLPMDDPAAQARAAASVVRWRPIAAASVGEALRLWVHDTAAVETQLRAMGSFEALLVVADLRMGELDPADARRVLDSLVAPGRRPASLLEREQHVAQALALVHACVALGEFADAEAALDRIRLSGSEWAAESQAEGLIALQRYTQAQQIALEVAERNAAAHHADIWPLRSLARIAQLSGDSALLERALRASVDADPFDAQAHLSLLQVYQAAGNRVESGRIQAIGARIRQSLASSTAVRRAIVSELLQRGLFADALDRALTLVQERPWEPAAIDLVIRTWQSAQRADPSAIDQGLAWVDAQLTRSPDSQHLRIARSRLLTTAGRPEQAEQWLLESFEQTRNALFQVERENLLWGPLQNPALAADLRLQRLRAAPPSIRRNIELATVLLVAKDLAEAAPLLRALPRSVELSFTQRLDLGRALAGAAESLFPERSAEAAAQWLSLVEWATERNVLLPIEAHAARVSLLADVRPLDVEVIRQAVALAARQQPADAPRLRYAAVGRLLEQQRLTDATSLLAALVQGDPEPPARVYGLWISLAAQAGSDQDVRTLVGVMPRGDRARAVLDELGATQNEGPSQPEARLMSRLGALLRLQARDALADEVYRAALELDPSDPWLSNDFGYRLLELGQRLDEAEVLIEHAFSRLTDRASVVDSMGWMRYHRGQIADERDADGNVIRPGAITLLERAAELAGDDPSAEVFEHLGDAHWRAGNVEKARAAWERALTLAEAEHERTRADGVAPGPRRLAEERLASIQARLDGLPSGNPPVAPMLAVP